MTWLTNLRCCKNNVSIELNALWNRSDLHRLTTTASVRGLHLLIVKQFLNNSMAPQIEVLLSTSFSGNIHQGR